MLKTDWMAIKQLKKNINQFFLQAVPNKVVLKEIRIPKIVHISLYLTDLIN